MVEIRHHMQRFIAAGAAGLMAATAAVAAAPALAAESMGECTDTHLAVTGGSFNWGIKQSWRDYVEGRVAKGGWETTGVGYNGSAFTFTPKSNAGGINDDGRGTVLFSGSLRFTGHAGALDMTLSDIALVVKGSTVDIRADYLTYDTDFITAGEKGKARRGNDVVIAQTKLNSTPTARASSLSLTGTTTLTSGGAELFGQYNAGTAMDRTGGTLRLSESCGKAPTGTSGNSGTTGNSDTPLGRLNDTFGEVNGLLDNTGALLDTTDQLYDRVWRDDAATNSGAATNPGNSGSPNSQTPPASLGTTGNRTTAGTGANGAASGASGAADTSNNTGTTGASPNAAVSGAPAAPAGTGSGEVCTTGDSLGVTQAQAQWGVRESFLNYISGSIANGGWEMNGVGHDGGQFIFSGDSGAVNPAETTGTILFPGSLRFTGHGGTLDTRFSNLEIQFSGNTGSLVVNASSNSADGEPKDYGRVALGTLNFSALDLTDSAVSGTADVILTDAGAAAFGDFYPAGDALDPISFRADLGGGASCAAGQGEAASTAGGGGDSTSQAAELRAAGGDSGTADAIGDAATEGSVFDQMDGDGITSADGAGNGDQFRIKAAGAEGAASPDRQITLVLLIVAAFVVAGASLSWFGRRNPNI